VELPSSTGMAAILPTRAVIMDGSAEFRRFGREKPSSPAKVNVPAFEA